MTDSMCLVSIMMHVSIRCSVHNCGIKVGHHTKGPHDFKKAKNVLQYDLAKIVSFEKQA